MVTAIEHVSDRVKPSLALNTTNWNQSKNEQDIITFSDTRGMSYPNVLPT